MGLGRVRARYEIQQKEIFFFQSASLNATTIIVTRVYFNERATLLANGNVN